MKLFESAWSKDWEYFERVYDTDLGKSIQRKIEKRPEYFVPKSTGMYSYVLDQSIKLDKMYGTYKQGSSHFGFQGVIGHHIRDEYWDENPDYSKYNTNPRIFFIDIETRSGVNSSGFPVPEKALEEISMFQILDSISNTMFLLGTKEWTHQEDYLKYGDTAKFLDKFRTEQEKLPFTVKYVNCKDELTLIKAFLKLYKELDPLILLAWNGAGFDYPYIYNRMKRLGLDPNELSNYGDVKYKESEFQGRKEFKIDVHGHYWIDLLDVYKKFVFKNHADYRLDTIAFDVLGDNKVQHDEYVTFDDFYTGNYNKPNNPSEEQLKTKIYHAANNGLDTSELGHSEFVWYGLKDTWLLKRIADRMNLVQIMVNMAKRTGSEIPDTLGTVKMWGQYLSNLLMKDNLIMPKKEDHSHPDVVGGYVAEPEVGKHEWVMSVDVNSMYPLLGMDAFNMSPETYVSIANLPSDLRDIVLKYYNDQDEGARLTLPQEIKDTMTESLQKHNLALGINGACFNREFKGIIPTVVRNIYLGRKAKRKELSQYEKRKLLLETLL